MTMNTTASAPAEATYLKEFERLGPHTYLHEPTKHPPKAVNEKATVARPPDLILLCTWMGAATKHIDKYTTAYVAKFPTATILLIRSELAHLTWMPKAQQVNRMKPAVSVIKRLVSLNDRKKPKVLLHVFSNGGSWTACMLAAAYKADKTATDLGMNLPVSGMISDSAPSLPHARIGYNAMTQTLGKSVIIRIVGGFVIWMIIIIAWGLDHMGYRQNILVDMRAKLNDTSGPFLGGVRPRLYICSVTDKMVPMEDVVAHAEEARKLLKKDGNSDADNLVKVEEFQGSVHVGHMMADRARYWRLVDDFVASIQACQV